MNASSSDILTLFPNAKRPGAPGNRRRKGAGKASEPEWAPIPVGAVLLSFDSAIRNVGWAVLRKTTEQSCERIDSGCWHPAAKGDANRFNMLYDLVRSRIVVQAESGTPATDAVVELQNCGPSWGMSWDDTRVSNQAIGVIEAACWGSGLITNRVRVREWIGNRKKSNTHAIVKALFSYDARDDHEDDAIALGAWLCGRPI